MNRAGLFVCPPLVVSVVVMVTAGRVVSVVVMVTRRGVCEFLSGAAHNAGHCFCEQRGQIHDCFHDRREEVQTDHDRDRDDDHDRMPARHEQPEHK